MKLRLALSLAILFALLPAVGQCAVVQAVGFQNGQTTATITQTIASTTAGDGLILACANYIDTKQPTSFVAGSATASTADGTYTDTADNYYFSVWSIPNIAGGLTSVTVNMSASAFVACIVIEESGLATSAMLDQISTANRQLGITSWNSNSITTTHASDIAYGFSFIPADGITFTAGSGWTELSGTGLTNGSSSETSAGTTQLFGERQVLSSTGSYQATGGGPSDTYTTVIVTYKSTASPPSHPNQFFFGTTYQPPLFKPWAK